MDVRRLSNGRQASTHGEAPIRERMGAGAGDRLRAPRMRHPHLDGVTRPFPLTRRTAEAARSTNADPARTRPKLLPSTVRRFVRRRLGGR